MLHKVFSIISENGIHARSATVLVSQASKFKSQITLEYEGASVDLKSIMGIMSLGLYIGDNFDLYINGVDEEEALKKITEIIKEQKIAKEV